MAKEIEEITSKVKYYWTKDLIIRFLYKELAPCFHRDLTFFLTSEEEKITQLKEGLSNNFPAVNCSSLADFYISLLKQYEINAKKVVASSGKIPLYALIVEGDFGQYYLDPINDLFENQYNLKPKSFAVLPRYQPLREEYKELVGLDEEYLSQLDNILGFSDYNDNAFSYLHKNLAHKHNACKFFGLPREITTMELIEKKLSLYQTLINKGEIEGYFERAQLYLYLNNQILNRGEKQNVCVKVDGGITNPYISYQIRGKGELVQYQEEKNEKGYVLLKKHQR